MWDVVYSGDCELAGFGVRSEYGQVKSCTITNKKRPRLTVTKVVVGDSSSTFDLSVGGAKVIDDGGDGATDTRSFSPSTYAVTETLGNGDPVLADVWDVVYSGDCDAQGSVSLEYGQVKSCTITNKKRPRLTVTKVVVGDSSSTFDLSVGGAKVIDDGGEWGDGYAVVLAEHVLR